MINLDILVPAFYRPAYRPELRRSRRFQSSYRSQADERLDALRINSKLRLDQVCDRCRDKVGQ
jgi:hypothetical protein